MSLGSTKSKLLVLDRWIFFNTNTKSGRPKLHGRLAQAVLAGR